VKKYPVYKKEVMNNNANPVVRIKLFRPNGKVKVVRVKADWTIVHLSHYYPICSKTGFDSLLYLVPEHERGDVTIEFYDSNGNATYDPRIFEEDL
jgi:hypothetical protein